MGKFDPKNLERLLSPERRRWQDPEVILSALGVAAGMTVADVGAGPGFLTLPAAKRVGPSGKVYALDVEPEMLRHLVERATAEGITNVETVISREDQLPLADGSVDAALLANVLHEASSPVPLLREIARMLRPEGALAVVEWKKMEQEMGPSLASRMAPEQVEALLREAGYRLVEPFEVGPYHYGLRARRHEGHGTKAG